MTRTRSFAAVVCMFATLLAIACGPRGCSPRAAPGSPNLLVIVADDLRSDCLGAMGRPGLSTPNIDALAADGTLFTNHFVTTSICACSRASIFTGQYAARHGILGFDQPLASAALAETYPMKLKDAGYRVGFVGKWGLGGRPPAKEFDSFHGYADRGSYWWDVKREKLRDVEGERIHDTPLCVKQALEFLRTGDDRPFCLSVSFKAPHGPFDEIEPKYADLYRDLEVEATPQSDEKLPEFLRDSQGGKKAQERTPEMFEKMVRDYCRQIAGLDAAVGEIRAEIATMGLDDKTVVVFTSDNGLFLGEHRLSGKWLAYEESIRVPLIVRDPSLPRAARGRREERMTLNIDIAPTILAFGGVAAPPGMQGANLRPLVAGESPAWRRDWLYEYHPPLKQGTLTESEAVRTERFAYIRYDGIDPPYEQLFDLAADPHEMHNLAAAPESASTLAELRARWKQLHDSAR